jgi:hypothetical protein
MDYTIVIDDIRRDLQLAKYNNLLQVVNDSNKKIINELIDEKYNNKKPITHNSINPFNNDIIKLSDNIYKTEWNKLKIFHKKNRIEKYINNLNISESEKKKLNLKYNNCLKNKTKIIVEYDSNIGEIISIK